MGTAANSIGFQIPVGVGAIALLVGLVWAYRQRDAMRNSLETIVEDAPANRSATRPQAPDNKGAQ